MLQEKFRLNGYYYIIEIVSLVTLVVIAAISSYFPEYITFVRYPQFILPLFVSMFCFNLFFFTLYAIFKKKSLFKFTRYAFIVFFTAIIYLTGGVTSPFIITFVFPLLVSAVDLKPEMTKKMAVILCSVLTLMIFADPEYLKDPAIVTEYSILLFIYVVLATYTYNLVKNTFTQKFEKEEATRKLFEMVEIDRLKTDFVTIASHQLRTPLSSAAWGLDNILSESTVSDENKVLIKESYDRIKRASQIVNEMLQAIDVSHIAANIEAEKIDLAKIVKGVMDELRYLVIRNGVKIEPSIVDHAIIEADPKLLKAGITNLVDNAIRYSPKGIVKVTLTVDDDNAKLVVKDNGSGILEEDMPYIFGKFFRGKNAMAIDPNESGVGLYITKRIIELHSGTISLKSESGKGTELSVTLPITQEAKNKFKQ